MEQSISGGHTLTSGWVLNFGFMENFDISIFSLVHSKGFQGTLLIGILQILPLDLHCFGRTAPGKNL